MANHLYHTWILWEIISNIIHIKSYSDHRHRKCKAQRRWFYRVSRALPVAWPNIRNGKHMHPLRSLFSRSLFGVNQTTKPLLTLQKSGKTKGKSALFLLVESPVFSWKTLRPSVFPILSPKLGFILLLKPMIFGVPPNFRKAPDNTIVGNHFIPFDRYLKSAISARPQLFVHRIYPQPGGSLPAHVDLPLGTEWDLGVWCTESLHWSTLWW